MLRVVGGHRSVSSRKKHGSRIFLSTMVLNFQNIEFPITLKDVTKFEYLNDVSIDVYAIEEQKTLNVFPIWFTEKEKHTNLL